MDEVNDLQKTVIVPKIVTYFNQDIKGKRIALWGLAFKPNTDDIREASSLYIIDELLKLGANVVAYDPEAMPNVKQKLGDSIEFADSATEAIKDADALVICTEWGEFKSTSLEVIKKNLKSPVVFDGRNIFDIEKMKEEGVYYQSIGR